MLKRLFYFEIFAVSLAAILLEISYTRIFSFKVWYYFTYMIIGVALLGLGTGGILVAISRRLNQADPARLIPKLCFFGGASVFAGYVIIARTQLNISELGSEPTDILKLILACLLLMAPFLAAGIAISKILSTSPEAAGRLYGADLLGAALGCITCIPLMVLLDPPRAVILAGLIFTIGGLRLALRSRLLLAAGGVICLTLLIPLAAGRVLPEPVVSRAKAYYKSSANNLVRFSKWHPVFRVDVCETGITDLYYIHHDGHFGSVLRRFEGDFAPFNYLREDSRALPFEVLPEGANVLIIGSAGGNEILASLFFGAEHIAGVELNPVTVSLLTDAYADFSGRLSENPRVSLISGEGRWFMKQAKEKYDLIWFVAPDSYAAMNASSAASFVLAESYLYTVEMLRESLNHLTERGIICTQFGEIDYNRKRNRTMRYVATARQAFAEQGIQPFERHVAVSTAAHGPPTVLSTVLLSKSPFGFEQIKRFHKKVGQLSGGNVRYFPGQRDNTLLNQVITLPESQLSMWYDEYPYLVDPVYDDSPYFWHFARFRDALASPLRVYSGELDYEDSIAERVSFILLGIVTIFAAFFLLLPFASIRKIWIEIPYKVRAGTYFASLGLGFMFIEVTLIQMLTLFLGYPTHSLSVTLFGLLLFAGLGSLLSERYAARRNRALGILMAAMVGLVVFYQFGLPIVIDNFVGRAFGFRVLLTITMIAPLGLCLGAFMPMGLTSIAKTTPHKREYVAWAWAVNGFFSVVASILSTILAMVIGFKMIFLLALAIYAVGVFSLTRLPQNTEG